MRASMVSMGRVCKNVALNIHTHANGDHRTPNKDDTYHVQTDVKKVKPTGRPPKKSINQLP